MFRVKLYRNLRKHNLLILFVTSQVIFVSRWSGDSGSRQPAFLSEKGNGEIFG